MKKLLLITFLFTTIFASATDTTLVNLQVGAASKFASIYVSDNVTGSNVQATISNAVVQNNNPEVATVIPNPYNATSIKATAVSAGTGTAVVSCNVSYVDPGDGQTKNESKTIVIKYTVIAAPHGVKLSLVFN